MNRASHQGRPTVALGMRRFVAAGGLVLGVFLVGASAQAAPRPPRDTGDVGTLGQYSVGIFNPLRIAVHDGIELQTHALAFLVAPNAEARFAMARGPVRLAWEMGVSLPTFGMRLLKGYLFPTWAESDNDIGWMLVPHLALVGTGSLSPGDALTLRADLSFRTTFGENNATPLNSFLAPLDLLFAAALTGHLVRVGAAYDHPLGDRFRVRGEVNLYVTGPQGDLIVAGVNVGPLRKLSPIYVTAHLGVDIAVFDSSRIALGVLFANYDQGKTVVVEGADGFAKRQRVRSNNFLPTLDYIWAGF